MNNGPCNLSCGDDFFKGASHCTAHRRTAKEAIRSIDLARTQTPGLDGRTDAEWVRDKHQQEAECNHMFVEQPGEPPVDVCMHCGKVEQ